jgi:hypothetical protein
LTSIGNPIAAGSSAPSTDESASTGTPASRIIALARIFEPIASIAAGDGPIHVRPASITAWANGADSARKP